jgi:hypothetical protein
MQLRVPRILTFKFLNSKTSVRSRIVAIAQIEGRASATAVCAIWVCRA